MQKLSNMLISNIQDPKKVRRFFITHKKNIACWGTFAFSVLAIYHLFSDGDFSFMLTLSSLIQMFGFIMVAFQVWMTSNVSIISQNTLICYAIALFAKLYATMFNEGYLPADKSGDFVYRISDLLAFIICIRTIYVIRKKLGAYKNPNESSMKIVAFLAIPSLVFAMFVHPSLNNRYLIDVAWTFALYLESVAMLPQLYLFTKNDSEIESYISHYVASQGFSRLFALIFWVLSFHELNEIHGEIFGLLKNYVGHVALFAQLVQLIILGDFVYHYVSSLRKGIPMRLPMAMC